MRSWSALVWRSRRDLWQFQSRFDEHTIPAFESYATVIHESRRLTVFVQMEDGENMSLLSEMQTPVDDSNLPSQIVRKFDRLFLVLLVVVILIAYADRTNIGFTAQDFIADCIQQIGIRRRRQPVLRGTSAYSSHRKHHA